MDLLEYIEKHAIVSGKSFTADKCVIVEMIPDNPKDLIKYVIKNNCYVSEILWWDRASIALGSKIGYGGPRDPRDPQNYYFAETDIGASFENVTTISEYIKYLDEIKKRYITHDLYPAFDIYKK